MRYVNGLISCHVCETYISHAHVLLAVGTTERCGSGCLVTEAASQHVMFWRCYCKKGLVSEPQIWINVRKYNVFLHLSVSFIFKYAIVWWNKAHELKKYYFGNTLRVNGGIYLFFTNQSDCRQTHWPCQHILKLQSKITTTLAVIQTKDGFNKQAMVNLVSSFSHCLVDHRGGNNRTVSVH